MNGGSRISASQAYLLFILMVVYVLNFVDRQLLSILADDVKADLQLTDRDLGFLLGTSFAVFYAIFGIPLGRASDVFRRKVVIASGISTWSVMTAASAFASSFPWLSVARMGVGAGEASASPAAYSMIYDAIDARFRTTALAVYSSGIYIGAGIGMVLGGWILTQWNAAFPVPEAAPLGLTGWRAVFLIVGVPGLLVAFFVAKLREPERGAGDGVETVAERRSLRVVIADLLALVPAVGAFQLLRIDGMRALRNNLLGAAAVGVFITAMVTVTGDAFQWLTLGTGIYCFTTWAQYLRVSDPVAFAMIFRCRTLVLSSIGCAGPTYLASAALSWLPAYFQRSFGATPQEVGQMLGLSYAVFGVVGVLVGGRIADKLAARRGPEALLHFTAIALGGAAALFLVAVNVSSKWAAYALMIPVNVLIAACYGPVAANISGLVVARIRSMASAAFLVVCVFLGSALSPYVVGALSDTFASRGIAAGDAVGRALALAALGVIPLVVFLIVAARTANRDVANRFERERALGVHSPPTDPARWTASVERT